MWKKIGTAAAALLLLGIGLVTLTAFRGGWCHGGHGDPAQMAAHVNARVDDLLDDVNATPDQRTQIHGIVDRMIAEAQQAHAGQKGTHDELFAQWKSDAPDAAKLHALVDQRVDELRKIAHDAVDAGVQVHGILTPDQRARLTTKMERWHR